MNIRSVIKKLHVKRLDHIHTGGSNESALKDTQNRALSCNCVPYGAAISTPERKLGDPGSNLKNFILPNVFSFSSRLILHPS